MSETSSRRRRPSRIHKPDLPVRKSERTHEAILAAAVDFFRTRPFRELTVGQLMSKTGSSRPTFYQYFTDLHDLMEHLLHDLEQDLQAASGPWFVTDGDPVPQLAESLAGVVKVSYQRGMLIRAVVEATPMDERLERAWMQFVNVFDDAVTTRIEKDQVAGLVPMFEARPVAIALNRMDIGTFIHHFGRRPRGKPDPVYQSLVRIWVGTIYGQESLTRNTLTRLRFQSSKTRRGYWGTQRYQECEVASYSDARIP